MDTYYCFATDPVRIPNIDSIGYSSDTKVTHFGPSVRRQYIIHYVLSGQGSFNGHPVEKGQGFLIVPGLYEEYHADKTKPWSFLWIISEDPAMQYFFDCHHGDPDTGIFAFHNVYELDAIVEQLRTSPNSFSATTQIAALFLRIFHTCVVSPAMRPLSVTKSYFDFSVQYIKMNLHLPITVAELCHVNGITQPYLYRIFKQAVGCSPKQYITSCKLTEAKRLLVQTELSISQVAAAVGFSNGLDFSKFFATRMGMAPTLYRERYR